MKKLIVLSLMVAALATTAQADLIAEYTFDTDASDTSGSAFNHDGILSAAGASVVGGELVLDVGGYMDLGAVFGTDNPFDHDTSDFRIEMDFKTTAANVLISSAQATDEVNGPTEVEQQSLHPLQVHVNTRWPGQARELHRLYYDKYWAGDPRIQTNAGDLAPPNADDFMDGEWSTLVIDFVADNGTGANEMTMTVRGLEVISSIGNTPENLTVALDTVRIGGSLNAGGYGEAGALNAMTVDNVRIYDVPEPATMVLLGLGGLVLRRRRKLS